MGDLGLWKYITWQYQAAASGEVTPWALGEALNLHGESSWLWTRKNFQTGHVSVGKEGIN